MAGTDLRAPIDEREAMRERRLGVALVLFIATALGAVGWFASPAGAEDAGTAACVYHSSRYLNSGVSSAQVHLEWCDGAAYLYGTIWDDVCDGRAAELEMWTYNTIRRTGQETRKAPNGCGTSATFRVYVRTDFDYASLWARACNFTPFTQCSDADYDEIW